MIGWKRIVVTVGEKIGKEHLTYGQGAAAELVAMGTIFAADNFGLPVSTTHVLSSGVAGTMAANGSGSAARDVAQYRDGLGADPALRDRAVGVALLDLPPHFLSTKTFLNAKPALPPGPAFLFAAFRMRVRSCRPPGKRLSRAQAEWIPPIIPLLEEAEWHSSPLRWRRSTPIRTRR